VAEAHAVALVAADFSAPKGGGRREGEYRWPPALGEEGGGASGLGESAVGELGGCPGGTAEPDAGARRGNRKEEGVGDWAQRQRGYRWHDGTCRRS
jgi:hypothetical protein